MRTLNPFDILNNETVVYVGNRRGYTIKAEIVPAVPAGMIVVHTVKLTDKRKILPGAHNYKWVPLGKSIITRVNYTAIQY